MMAQSEAQFVTFAMGEEIFAVPVEVVREILDLVPTGQTENPCAY